jgi:hypothetical protein
MGEIRHLPYFDSERAQMTLPRQFARGRRKIVAE